MPPEQAKHLQDMLDACEEISTLLGDLSEAAYRDDLRTHRAIERCLSILAEALYRLIKCDASYADRITHAAEIRRFRNILVHGYHAVRHEIVYDIARHDVPELQTEVRKMLDDLIG